MVQAIININENEDKILNMVKASQGLKNKSEVVNTIIRLYGDELVEPEIRPEYLKELKRISKGKYFEFKSVKDLKKFIEHK